jgi:hypothetical protein
MESIAPPAGPDPGTSAFYGHALTILAAAGVPFLVGGAYALHRYTGIERHTKDLDIFVRPHDAGRVLAALRAAGYHAALVYPHWLGKASCGEDFVDVIFGSGNGVAVVDDGWFAHAVEDEVLGLPVKLAPAEEMIWSKAFVMERERYDGADVAHLLHGCAERLDWNRLLARFGEHWRVLFAHLVLFGFIYPGECTRIPPWVTRGLMRRLETELEAGPADARVCRGTLLSREQYLADVECWGYRDARLRPLGAMTPEQVALWTRAIEQK